MSDASNKLFHATGAELADAAQAQAADEQTKYRLVVSATGYEVKQFDTIEEATEHIHLVCLGNPDKWKFSDFEIIHPEGSAEVELVRRAIAQTYGQTNIQKAIYFQCKTLAILLLAYDGNDALIDFIEEQIPGDVKHEIRSAFSTDEDEPTTPW